MQRESPRAAALQHDALDACLTHPALPVQAFSSLVARNNAAKERLAHLARTIEADVIPRLVQAHRVHGGSGQHRAGQPAACSRPSRWPAFVDLIVGDSEAGMHAAVDAKRRARHVGRGACTSTCLRRRPACWVTCGSTTTATSPPSRWRWAACSACCANSARPSAPRSSTRPTAAARCLPSRPTSSTVSACRWWPSSSAARAGTWSACVGGAADDPGLRLRQRMGRRGRLLDRLGAPPGLAARPHRRGARRVAQPGRGRHGRRADLHRHPELGGRGGCRRARPADARDAPRVAARLLMATPRARADRSAPAAAICVDNTGCQP